MGFLNHATNNIIIDAVLTERGRELLARNDGSFNISSFVFGDDEVDYSIINKYGLTIGKEKIEKNTPIFEANPNENIAIKHPLISFPNPLLRLTQIPSLKWANASSGETKIDLFDTRSSSNDDAGVTKFLTIKNSINGIIEGELDENITDSKFLIKMHGSLLKISNEEVEDTDINGIDTYSITTTTASDPEWSNQVSSSFTVYSNGVVSATDFQKFASISNSNKINTSIQIIGASSGASLVIPVVITKRSTV
tara:strand:- start:517 stop:1272 length:756 start_codon:yes stop_codon:yes gene_type:complete